MLQDDRQMRCGSFLEVSLLRFRAALGVALLILGKRTETGNFVVLAGGMG